MLRHFRRYQRRFHADVSASAVTVDETGEVAEVARVLNAIAVTIKLIQYLWNLARNLVRAGNRTGEQSRIKRRPALAPGNPR